MIAATKSITAAELSAIQGTPSAPLILDVRRTEVFRAASGWIAGALHCSPEELQGYVESVSSSGLVLYCDDGVASGSAAIALSASHANVRVLDGGIAALRGTCQAGQSGALVPEVMTVRRREDLGVDGKCASRWVTRERPKIDRVACPWLIRRFIDPRAEFHYVPASDVFRAAADLKATAYDLPGAPITHEWERCSFDSLLGAFELRSPLLERMATVVRAADTGRPSLAPESKGLLALSQGLSRLYQQDDYAMLAAAMTIYDALYAWACDQETKPHTWREHDACATRAR